MTAEPLTLPALDPARQRAAERAALLIEAAGDGSVRLRARIEHGTALGCWLSGADGIALRIDALDGVAAALTPERVEAAVAALDRLEPLLDLIEARTGWVVEPDAAADRPAPGVLVIGVEALRDGAGPTRFALAVPEALAATIGDEAADAAARLGAVPIPCALSAAAAHLDVEEAGALAAGDLLLLDPGPWRATLAAGPLGGTGALFDPLTGRATRADHEGRTGLGNGEATGAEAMRAFRVPIEVALPHAAATLAELAALREGGTLALGPVAAGLPVALSVGGRPLATGELVRLGDRFAVVVERLADAPAPAAPEDAG